MKAPVLLLQKSLFLRNLLLLIVGLFVVQYSTGSAHASSPGPGIAAGAYYWSESWKYEKVYSSEDIFDAKRDGKKRLVLTSRNHGYPMMVYFPDGSVVRAFSRTATEDSGLWLGQWSFKKGVLKIDATSSRHSGHLRFKRVNRTDWIWTGYHAVDGKRIGTGWGSLRKIR